MNMKENKGFTLVELIVVIAILGILAAVAVPAYTGYITRAHEAADITKLDAAGTAVQAACALSGVGPSGVSATFSVNDGKITLAAAGSTTDAQLAKITNDFKTFNNNSDAVGKMEYYTSVTYSNGVFTGSK